MSAAAHAEFREKEHAYLVAKDAYKEAHRQDIVRFEAVAREAWGDRSTGTVEIDLRDFKENDDESFFVDVAGKGRLRLYKGDHGYRWQFNPEFVDHRQWHVFVSQIDLSNDMLFFLDWSRAFATHIWAFWREETWEKTLEEFITRMQETCVRSYSTAEPMIKAARES